MKLRIRGNSIRLRLTRHEVATVGGGGRVTEVVIFTPETTFTYALEAADSETLQATYANNMLLLQVPREAAKKWADSEQVGLHAEEGITENVKLTLMVEKDFACLSPRGEEDTDTFEHPLTGQMKC